MASPAPTQAQPQPGDRMRVSAPNSGPGTAIAVTGRQGNYVLLESGHRFHVLDDRMRDGFWMTGNTSYCLLQPEPQIP